MVQKDLEAATPQARRQLEELKERLREAETRRAHDLAKFGKWADRIIHDFDRILRSNRWRLGCWLSLKRSGHQSKEAQRLARLLESRPQSDDAQTDAIPATASRPEERRRARNPISPLSVLENERLIGHLVTIVIPVYNAHDDLIQCLESVQRHSKKDYPILLIDDASPDERIWPLLQQWQARHQNFRAVRNEMNLGYTATLNRACQLAGLGDIILLNSDTIVPHGWIEQMAACAYSRPDVATVTAISNAAGAFSVPVKNAINQLPHDWQLDKMAAFVERLSSRIRPAVPTGNGFCIYLTAAARLAVGQFDSKHFPRGYGEENDYCLRASAAGLVNLIDDATYVFHRRSASFGAAKEEILKTSRAMLDRLHPKYNRLIKEWNQNDALDPFREEIQRLSELANTEDPDSLLPNENRPCLLFILHDGMGGTRFTTEDLFSKIATDYRIILLRAALDNWTLAEYIDHDLVPVRRYSFANPWRLDRPMTSGRVEVLREIGEDYRVRLAHVRHLLATGPELLPILKEMGMPVIFSFHDFYAICPTIQLLDETKTYCAGVCTDGPGDCSLSRTWFQPPLPWLKHRYVHEHQRQMSAALESCDACVTTSEASRSLLLRHFPKLGDNERFTVIEHGRDLPRLDLAKPPETARAVSIVFFGSLNVSKGLNLMRRLLERNQQEGGPFQFHFLGEISHSLVPEKLGGIYHGPYLREELADRLRVIAPSFSLIPSLWPETYCHVLSESWAMGLPVFASDLGTLRERIQQHGGGWLLPVGDADRWFTEMREVAANREAYAAATREIRKIEIRSVAWMAKQYDAIYTRLLAESVRREKNFTTTESGSLVNAIALH